MRVAPNEQMHVIGHDFRLDEFLPPPLNLLGESCFDPYISRQHEHLTSVLRAEDDA